MTTKLRRFICTDSSYALEREEDSKYGLHGKGAAIYKEAKALGKSYRRF